MEEHPAEQTRMKQSDRVALIIGAIMIAVFLIAFTVFAIRQTAENKKTAAKISKTLTEVDFILDDREFSEFYALYVEHCKVVFSEDGTATLDYAYNSENLATPGENMTPPNIVETHNRNTSTEPWSVRVSLMGKITVRVGDTVFVVHKDEFGVIDYLIENGYKIYYSHTRF